MNYLCDSLMIILIINSPSNSCFKRFANIVISFLTIFVAWRDLKGFLERKFGITESCQNLSKIKEKSCILGNKRPNLNTHSCVEIFFSQTAETWSLESAWFGEDPVKY